MFRGLINDAKSAAGAMIGKYVARASVAVPFIIAAGFAVAAITLLLVDRFGAIRAYFMVAGGFTAIGIIAGLAVKVKEREEEAADAQVAEADTSAVASEAATQAAMQAPLALLGALFSTPLGPSAAANGVKLLARNLPLVVLLVLIGALFWPTEPGQAAEGDAEDAPQGADSAEASPFRPNGAHGAAGDFTPRYAG
jgi:hypothetical protein